jgi:hypothetical protein
VIRDSLVLAEDVASEEQPLLAPVVPGMSWSWVHDLTQSPPNPGRPQDATTIARIRRSATIRRGTRMIKFLTARQFASFVRGRLPGGFCYRSHDVAHLRTSTELAMLTGDATTTRPETVVFGLRWRALDAADYQIPFSMPVDGHPVYGGLAGMRGHDRLGPPILGTGFAPSSQHVIPEFITTDLADLPMPAKASLVAFTEDGTEVTLYLYLPEQRAWTRMFGPQWRHLFAAAPTVSIDQEFVPIRPESRTGSSLIGEYQGHVYEAVADPPVEYRVLAMIRAARYPVEALARRTLHARWRGVPGTVARIEGDWVRLRLVRPDTHGTTETGAECVERGVYECWAPAAELTDRREHDHEYDL